MADFINAIYTVTTLGRVKYNELFKEDEFAHSRTVGFYTDLNDAKRCVNENWGDIYEVGSYPFALIERVETGLYGVTKDRWLYEWNNSEKGYVLREEFPFMKHYVGYSMG